MKITVQARDLNLASFILCQGGRLTTCERVSNKTVCWHFEDGDIARKAVDDYDNGRADGELIVEFVAARERLIQQARRVLETGQTAPEETLHAKRTSYH